jgi:hypothetical protein
MVKSFSAGVSCSQLFSGLSGEPWQARKYSVWRDDIPGQALVEPGDDVNGMARS